jgi:hypothetical protein
MEDVARRKASARSERRSMQRAAGKLTRDRERLAYLEPGAIARDPSR